MEICQRTNIQFPSADSAYEAAGKKGCYQHLVGASVIISMVTAMIFVFSLPLLLVFPKVSGCEKPGGDSTCSDPEEACDNNYNYYYENPHHTLTAEFDLLCSPMKAAALEVAYGIGSLIGCSAFSMLSDNIGRLLCLGQAGIFFSVLIIAIFPNYNLCAILSGVAGLFSGACGPASFALAFDSVHSSQIQYMGTLVNLAFAGGEVGIALLLWSGLSWREMCFVIAGWSISFFLFRIKLREPPKFLYAKGRKEEGNNNLRYISVFNSKNLPENFEVISENNSDQETTNCKEIAKIICQQPNLKHLFMCMSLYFTCASIYYGISMNIQHYNGNPYATATLNGVVEIIAIFLSSWAMDLFGRKLALSVSFAITGLFSFLHIIVKNNSSFTLIAVSTSKFGISSSFNLVYIAVGQLFPTSVKNTALGIGILADRIGTIIGAILGLNQAAFVIISTLLCVICIIIVYRLPPEKNQENELPSPQSELQLQASKQEMYIRGVERYYFFLKAITLILLFRIIFEYVTSQLIIYYIVYIYLLYVKLSDIICDIYYILLISPIEYDMWYYNIMFYFLQNKINYLLYIKCHIQQIIF